MTVNKLYNKVNGKVAAITGAGSGMGRSLALKLAKAGCEVAISDVDEKSLKETYDLILSSSSLKPGSVSMSKVNIANESEVYDWADRVNAEHGKVNFIFNNAGVALSGTVGTLSLEEYRWIMDINFWGVVYGTKAFLPYLEAAEEGHIINTSSVFGLTSQPFMSAYNASKFAVRGFTESLRQDLELAKSKVSATSVHPGGIKTNISKLSKMNDSVTAAFGKDVTAVKKQFEKEFMTTAGKASEVILKAVIQNKRRVLIGPDAYVFDYIVRLFPAFYQRIFTFVAGQRAMGRTWI